MAKKLSKTIKSQKIEKSSDVYMLIRKILMKKDRINRDKEHLWVMILDSSKRIKHLELIGLGTVNEVCTSPVEIFSVALYKRAVKLVLIHNHPGGDLRPSKSDLELTYQLQKVSVFMDIPIVDHLIIGTKGYFSFADNGLL